MAIPDTANGRRKVWRDIGEWVRKSARPLHLADFAKYIGTNDRSRQATPR